MTLRKKTLLIISVTFLSLAVILYFISQHILLDSFTKLEEQNTRQNVERVLRALSNELYSLESIVGDWAAWDDTYAFIEDANAEYIRSNLIDGTFTELRLNLMMFIHSSGRAVFVKAFDLYSEGEISIPFSLQEHLAANDPLVTRPNIESGIRGIVLLTEGPMLVASQPILTSEDEGPIRGTLIVGRYLDAAEIERLAEQTQLYLIIHRLTDPQIAADFQAARSSLSEEVPIFIQPLDKQSVAGYTILKDIYSKPSLLLRVDMPRDIYEQGQATITYLILAIVAVGAVFGAVTMLSLEKQVLSRLARLSKSVTGIGKSGDPSARVPITGTDELSTLGGTINEMLAALHQYQGELQESEEKLRLMFESMTEGIAVSDLDGNIVQVNEAVVRMHGYNDKRELIGRSTLDLIAEKDHAKARENLKRTLEQGYVKNTEYTFLTRDGREFDAELSSAVLKDASGNPTELMAITRDITERKQAEQELQEKSKELEAASRAKSEFVANISHELRTPLSAVIGFSELMLDGVPGKINKEQRQCLNDIYSSGKQLLNIINDILDLSKIEARKLELKPEKLKLADVINDVVQTMKPMLDDNGHVLKKVGIEEGLPQVSADKSRLKQILFNLLSNASKFTPPGGKLGIEISKDGNWCQVSVVDNGIGIKKKDQKRIFEAFTQADTLPRRKKEGTGLGLSLTKQLVEMHGGKIWVESKYRKGSKFAFTIPLAPPLYYI